MGYKAAVQVLKKAEALKTKVASKNCDLLNDLQAWTDQQQLQTIYHQVLVLDLEYALDRKVEQELWTLGFKNHISVLQEQARDKKNIRRSESQALLSWCLEAASGFYLTLLQELSSTYDLDLPFRKHGAVFGNLKTGNYIETNTLPQSSSCLYICQYCLVHLGDIARYRNQRKQAESFYKHAILVSPNSGHPYNQLALLEASQGDKLSTVFHYIRGIAVKNPFPGASTNLANTLSAAIDKDDPLTEVQTKMSVNEFTNIFLKVHGLLHNDFDLQQAELCVKSINATLTALVATQSFTTMKLIKMTVINLFALKHIVGDHSVMDLSHLTGDEVKARELVLDLIAGSLSAFLLPVYTLKAEDLLLDYYALAAIYLISVWIQTNPIVLADPVFTNRLQIWPGYCKLLNCLQQHTSDEKFNKVVDSKVPLSLDKELEGFLPLQDCFKSLNFKLENVSPDEEKYICAKRLIDFGTWLTKYETNEKKLITCSEDGSSKLLQFEPACIQPDPTSKLLEEMRSVKVSETETKMKTPEKKGGILKPQGSLEKSREERVQVKQFVEVNPIGHHNNKLDSVKLKKLTTQNVALQSIYKKLEENKQVKFSTETTDKDKEKISPKIKPPMPRQTINPPPPNPPYRTQTFNQNHPGLGNLSVENPVDYFNINYHHPPSNINYQNNDMLKLPNMHQNMQFSVPPPSIYNNPPPSQQQTNIQQNNFTPIIEKPMSFNIPAYNERSQNNWWPSHMNKSPNIPHQQPPQQPDYYRYGNQYVGGNTSNDLFSPWNAMPQTNTNIGFSNTSQGMSMRQAMLNEAKHIGGTNNMVNNAPGYSLFNTTAWAPSLPGQLRSSNNDNMRQQSLFTGPPPQSLQQLLEQQNQMQKPDNT